MFFVLSKAVALILSPLFIAIAIALLAIFIKRYRRVLMLTSLAIILVFSNPMLFRLTIQWWEGVPEELPQVTELPSRIVLLGGMSALHEPSGRVRVGVAGDRLFQALALWSKMPDGTLIITGGSAAVINKERGEAAFLNEFIADLGMDVTRLHVDTLSRNTRENAINTAKIFDKQGWDKSAALVTSAWHMPRAKASFEKEGFAVVPVKADHMFPFSRPVPADYFIPSARVLVSWEFLVKEWVGLVYYKLKGFI